MQALMGETKEESSSAPGAEPDDDSMIVDASDNASDIVASDGSESGSGSKKATTKQKELRQKMQTQALAKQREAARAKQASQKQAMAEYRRLDEEVNKLERRLEGIERDFRKLLGVVRVKPLGRDRFYNRVWWFDGMGSASLVGSGGASQYGTGRIFIQGASDFDVELLQQKQQVEDVDARRKEEEGEEGMLSSSDWAVFSDIEEVRLLASTCFLIFKYFFRLKNS
jgi:bromodomain adjacent to zinc finger domain protein 1A